MRFMKENKNYNLHTGVLLLERAVVKKCIAVMTRVA